MIMPSWSFPRIFGKHHGHSRLVDSLGAIPPSTNAAAIPYNRKISGGGLYFTRFSHMAQSLPTAPESSWRRRPIIIYGSAF